MFKHTVARRHLTLTSLSLLLTQAARVQAEQPRPTELRCEQPAVQKPMLLILLDKTTELPSESRGDFLAGCVSAAANRRTVVLTMGGEAPSLLTRCFDEPLPAKPTEADLRRQRWTLSPADRAALHACAQAAQQRLHKAIEDGLRHDAGKLGRSPIFQALAAACAIREAGQPLLLIIVSDGIQHDGLSFYGKAPDTVACPPIASVVQQLRERKLVFDARGVIVWHIGRGLSGSQTKSGVRVLRPHHERAWLAAVWNAYLEACGASGYLASETGTLPLTPEDL